MLPRPLLRCLLILCLWPALPASASAQPAAQAVTEHVEATLVAEGSAVPGQRLTVALRLVMIPGWHTYWRNPGDSGLETTIAWTLPDGVAAGPIQWPYPEAVPVPPLMNYGYEGTVLLLTDIAVPAGFEGDTLPIHARADWLVCADICIPESAELALDVPVSGTAAPDPSVALAFEQARAALPLPAPFPVAVTREGSQAVLAFQSEVAFEAARFFPYDDSIIAAADQPFAGRSLTLSLASGFRGERLSGILVASSRGWTRAYEIAPALAAAAPAAPVTAAPRAEAPATAAPDGGSEPLGLVLALAFALLGGMILNLMPCVLPVLSMKALALAGHEQEPGARSRLRRDGLAYTAGVLVCFAGLAMVLLVLRGAGAAVGWGFQLQSPVVVGLLALLFGALGMMFLGAVEFGGRLAGLGDGMVRRGGVVGSFATGLLAAIVATPCTAPFMGAALGFAVTQPAPLAVGIFLALGFGMALPFLVITLVPALVQLLPRPGGWMIRFRQFLAFPMFASAAWLIWVVAIQAGPMGVAAILGALVLLGFAAWAWALGSGIGRLVAIIATIGALAGVAQLRTLESPAARDEQTGQAFSADRLASLRADGHAVFVNLTAAWCITCLVNERVALDRPAVAERMAARDITYLKGDWTNQDPEITALLAAHGRTGVPLYLAYPRDGSPPLVLPQILTESTVLDALDQL